MRPWMIGIAGPSCSGKSELAAAMARRLSKLSPVVVRIDDYYRDLAALDPSLRDDRNFDHPDAIDRGLLIRQLDELSYGRAVEAPVYRFKTHDRAEECCRIEPGVAVIVEGIFTHCWPGVRELFGARVFLDGRHATCLERRLARDVAERGRTPESVRDQYRRTVQPMYDRYVRPTRRFADLMLCGEDPVEHNADILERWLQARFAGLPTLPRSVPAPRPTRRLGA